jgi:UDP-glucose 4-epimerase
VTRPKLLITGGCGFIGSHFVNLVSKLGFPFVVIDNLSKSTVEFLPLECTFISGDLRDKDLLDDVFKTHNFQAVIHFAGDIEAGESVRNPLQFYDNNVGSLIFLLQAMVTHKIGKFVFSSSAAVYGSPDINPILEETSQVPTSPYGMTKSFSERILFDCHKAHGLDVINLRYFNAAGAHPHGDIGECHNPETHIIPLALEAALDPSKEINIYGTDYPTSDGTCVRDYVHVVDIAQAHKLALDRLFSMPERSIFESYNLGNNRGYSVLEVLETIESVTGKVLRKRLCERRAGDPPFLVADSKKALKDLGWRPQYPDLMHIIQHAWNFLKKRQAVASFVKLK